LEWTATLTLFRPFGRVGEVVEGFEVVELVEKEGTASGKPKKTVTITDCGVI